MPRAVTIAVACTCLITMPALSAAQPAAEAPAEPTPDYAAMAREVIRSHQLDPEGENGWPLFVRVLYRGEGALTLLAGHEEVQTWEQAWRTKEGLAELPIGAADGRHFLAVWRNAPEELTDEQRQTAATFLRRLEKTDFFQGLDELCAQKNLVPPVVSPLLPTSASHLGAARSLAGLCSARMLDARDRGDDDAVVQSFRHMLAIGRAVACDVGVLPRLISSAVYTIALRTCTEVVVDGDTSAELARRLAAELDQHRMIDAGAAVETERLQILNAIALTYDQIEAETRDAAVRRGGAAALIGDGFAALTAATEPEARRLVNEYLDGLRLSMSDDQAERAVGIEKMKAVDALCDEENGPMHVRVVCMLLPAAGKFRLSERRIEAMQRGVRTLLAVERFRMAEGRPPATLEELVPRYLKAVPADPYAEGAPLRYRALEEGEDGPEGQTYILYTVGGDAEDNGGKLHPETAEHALSPARSGKGYDFVFNNLGR